MCGICGIYNFDKRKKVESSSVEKMAKALSHRGPDGEGFYFGASIGLGHKRLAIIDLSSRADQPMANEDGSVWITFNGEIYNYIELRAELIKKGHLFKSDSDTEVIIHLYESFGEKFLEYLNGMFSFSLYDKKKNKMILARDRLGVKPLYYFKDTKRIIFASEIKAILEAGIQAKPDYKAIGKYVNFQFCLGDKTFFKGVKKIEPGHYLIADEQGVKVKKYWDLDYSIDERHSEKYFLEKLNWLLNDSVRLELRSDALLGTHLSGGIDSTSVACLARRNSNLDLKCFTGAFNNGEEYNETRHSRLASAFIKAKPFEIYPTENDFINIMPKLIYYMDEPAGGPGIFPQYFVSKIASQNVKVVLGGQGGDEVWGGYARYIIAYLEQALKGAVLNNLDEGKYVVTLRSIISNLSILKNYEPIIKNFFSQGFFAPMDERYLRLIKRSEENSSFSREFLKKAEFLPDEFKKIFNFPDTPSYFNKMTHFDIKNLLPALLQVEDRTSMANSLESRVPLLDHRIVELSAKIPPKMKFKGGKLKYMLKEAIKGVIPNEILERKDKIGFAVPLTEWYKKNPVKNFINETLASKRARERGIFNTKNLQKSIKEEKKFGREVWGMLCLELWFKEFIDA